MGVLTAEDRDRAREMLRALGAHPSITTEDGTVLDLPRPVTEALAEILEAAADGERALVLRSPENLTTEQAAAVLGVSRPTVVRLIESGRLPARMVGTHRRLALRDVLAHREASAKRRTEALEAMTREAEELEVYGRMPIGVAVIDAKPRAVMSSKIADEGIASTDGHTPSVRYVP